jgi:uncharacterized membrane-anchored protein
MSSRRELAAVFGGLVLVIAVAVGAVMKKEAVLKDGELVLLQLAPVDPRSLIQGDYMQLRYAIDRNLVGSSNWPDDGHVVMRLDEHDVATFVQIYYGQPLTENEIRLRYRRRAGQFKIGPNAFYFQEGHASHYANARYGAVRVSDSGDVVLVGMRNEDFTPSGPLEPPLP